MKHAGRGGTRTRTGRKPNPDNQQIHLVRINEKVHGLLKSKTRQYRSLSPLVKSQSMIDMIGVFLSQQENFPALAVSRPEVGKPSKWIKIRHTDYLTITQMSVVSGLSKSFLASSLILLGDARTLSAVHTSDTAKAEIKTIWTELAKLQNLYLWRGDCICFDIYTVASALANSSEVEALTIAPTLADYKYCVDLLFFATKIRVWRAKYGVHESNFGYPS